MAPATARAPKPGKRKGRAGGTARPSLKLHNTSATTDSITALRLQRLRLIGIIGARAGVLASLAWENGHAV